MNASPDTTDVAIVGNVATRVGSSQSSLDVAVCAPRLVRRLYSSANLLTQKLDAR